MALSTKSLFYYGWEIDSTNRYIDFDDGVDTLQAVLTIGSYTSQELADEIALQMNSIAGQTFVVTYNRTTMKFTIAGDSNFELLFSTGSQAGQSVASLIGFAASDYTAAATYTAPNTSGTSYAPQFYLQSYKPTDKNRRAIDAVVNKSASGVVEVIKFGNERFMSCEIMFISDVYQASGSVIENDPAAVSSYIDFIEWATDKGKLEFMPDIDDVSTYEKLMLEKTEQDENGLDYELIELYDKNLPNFFRSGVLKFRLLE